jgi:hypothetical protein
MKKSLLKELLELTPAERIELAGDLWDSIEPHEMPALTLEQEQEMSDGTPSTSAIRKAHPSGTRSKSGFWRV